MPTYRFEERLEDGLRERILAYEEQAVQILTEQAQPKIPTVPSITVHTTLKQTKSARSGASTPIRLAEKNAVPRYYLSTFELTILYDGKPLAEPGPDGTLSMFSAFAPIVCANRDEVLWYDYCAGFVQTIEVLSERLAHLFQRAEGPETVQSAAQAQTHPEERKHQARAHQWGG